MLIASAERNLYLYLNQEKPVTFSDLVGLVRTFEVISQFEEVDSCMKRKGLMGEGTSQLPPKKAYDSRRLELKISPPSPEEPTPADLMLSQPIEKYCTHHKTRSHDTSECRSLKRVQEKQWK